MAGIRHILLLLCCGMVWPAMAQELSTKALQYWPGRFAQFSVDQMGQVYLLTTGGQLKKFGSKGDSIGVFNEVRQYGRLTSMDVSNPLKPLLYYADFGTLVELDRFLRVVNVLDLRKAGIFQARAVARSYDNQIWVYDAQETRLRKLSEDGRILLETPELRSVMDEPPSPAGIYDRNGMTYMYDPLQGLYVFDYYGTFQKRLLLTDWTHIEILEGRIIGVKDRLIQQYGLKIPAHATYKIPATMTSAAVWRFTQQGVYCLDETGVFLYPMPQAP